MILQISIKLTITHVFSRLLLLTLLLAWYHFALLEQKYVRYSQATQRKIHQFHDHISISALLVKKFITAVTLRLGIATSLSYIDS